MKNRNLLFIVGPNRCGSKVYQNALNNLPNVKVFNELHFLRPWWVGSDFIRAIEQKCGNLEKDENLYKLTELLSSKNLPGSFWSRDAPNEINIDKFITRLRASKRTPQSILNRILDEISAKRKESLIGIRDPVHICHIDLLGRWYPLHNP